MKNLIFKIASGAMMLLAANTTTSNAADFAGKFGTEKAPGGYYLYCQGKAGFCGTSFVRGGAHYFQAANGSLWVYSAEVQNPEPGANDVTFLGEATPADEGDVDPE